MKGLLKAVAVIALLLIVLGILGSALNPKSGTSNSAPKATSAPYTGVYYLYYKDKPSASVPVMKQSKASMPVSGEQFETWFIAGDACPAESGAKASLANVNKPFGGQGVEIIDGRCRGFVGWVPIDTVQRTPP